MRKILGFCLTVVFASVQISAAHAQVWKRLSPKTDAVENAVCNSAVDGAIATNASGLVLSCQSGVWAKSASTGQCWKMNSTNFAANLTMNCFGSSAANVVAYSVCFGQTDDTGSASVTAKIQSGAMRVHWDNVVSRGWAYESVLAAQFSPC